MAGSPETRQVPTFCALCVSRCGARATVTDGEFVALHPDPSHPTGHALCVKDRAGPDLVNHPDRLRYPVGRTAAKGAADAARRRGIGPGDWVRLDTPLGSVRARAGSNASLDPQAVCGQHGWWQGCAELGLPGYPPLGPGSANLNAVLGQGPSDPISGSSPLRAPVCDLAPLDGARAEPAAGRA